MANSKKNLIKKILELDSTLSKVELNKKRWKELKTTFVFMCEERLPK